MGDIALIFDADLASADFSIEDNDLLSDAGLETAIMLSLFTNRVAEDGDVLPDDGNDRQGWWADAVPVVDGDRFGSRLWLLQRCKNTADIPGRAEEYCKEAVQWMIDDHVLDRVDVESEIIGNDTLGIKVTPYRPKADPVSFRFNYNWAAQEAKRG